MRVLVGTSGYSYKAWKGSFYPGDLPDAEMLAYYGGVFPTVEINNTFYRMPSPTVLARWAETVPPEFTFVLKAPRFITHQTRLTDAEALAYFLKAGSALGRRWGPTLFQLPPFLRKDLGRLRDFLGRLPPERPAAFEFRHPSWFDEEVLSALRDHGAALCVADTDESPAPASLPASADWGYLRLRREEYSDGDLGSWAERIRSQPWQRAFVFFKHEDGGTGPRLGRRLLELTSA